MFFCSSVEKWKWKLKSQQWKKEWDNQRNSFRKSCKSAGAMQNAPCPKNKKMRSLTYCYKKWAVSHQQTAEICISPPPFCPFSKGTQNYINHIALIICALQTIFCIFVFLRFCVLNFSCEMGRRRKGLPSGERLNKNSIRYLAHICRKKRGCISILTHPQYDRLNERL